MDGEHRASSPGLREHLRIVSRRKWIILACALLAPATAVALSLRQQALYEASADVLLSRQDLAAALTNTNDPLASQDAERLAETQVNVARVPRVAARALDAAGVRDRSVGDLLDHSSVSAKPSADILVFKVTDPNPRLAARLANEYAGQFIRYRRILDTASLKLARREIRERISELEDSGSRNSQQYANFVEKDQELATLEALRTSNAQLLRPAGDAAKTQPRPLRNGLTGLALGLLLGLGLAVLWEALDTRVRSGDEIGERLGLPLLGRVSEPPRRFRSKGLATRDEPSSPIAEAFRVLRTNLTFVNAERDARTIMVSSAAPGEGKSTTALNLALAFARGSKRVALVELDLRRPSLARVLELEQAPGLTDAVVGLNSLDEAITTVPLASSTGGKPAASTNGQGSILGRLDILVAGSLPPNPGEFVGTEGVRKILGELRARYDLVLIDAPPLLHVGDARALAAHVDALLLVVRLGIARRQSLTELRRTVETLPAPVLGFVLAGAELEEGYGYDSYAYYGHEPSGRRGAAPSAVGASAEAPEG